MLRRVAPTPHLLRKTLYILVNLCLSKKLRILHFSQHTFSIVSLPLGTIEESYYRGHTMVLAFHL